jgi:E3 ubiquitin-protein ligase RFWD3
MDDSFEYEDYEDYEDDDDYDIETVSHSSHDFIDDNNYTLHEDEDNELSVQVIESDEESVENERQMDVQNDDNHSSQSNAANEADVALGSEDNSDTKDVKPLLNASMLCTQENCDNCCIICTELWTNTGDHQLVSLSCGHLFGRRCIEQWLDPKNRQNQRCPQCNFKAKRKDIRLVYARNLRALDTSERDATLELLRKERVLRQRLESEAIINSVKLKSALEENERIKKELMTCQQRIQHLGSSSRITENIIKSKTMTALNSRSVDRFQCVKELEISKSGECRHLGYSSLFEVIAVSQPNPNPQLFPGFGIRKIFLNDFKTDNICIHSKPIKDLEINAYDGTVLTTSSDRTVKLTSLLNKASIMSYSLQVEAWSVTFNPKSKHEFYVGLNNGQILLFDNRMMSTHMDRLTSADRSPVVSLNHIQFKSSIGSIDGILSTQFHNCCFYERNNSCDSLSAANFSSLNIPFEGRFSSAHFDPKSGLVLLSCRPSSKHNKVTHYVSLSLSLSLSLIVMKLCSNE